MKIYADHAATTAVSDTAMAAMLPCFQGIYANPSSLHSPGQRAAEKLVEAREIFARNLNAAPREITFTSGGSESDVQALRTGAALGPGRASAISSPPSLSTMQSSTPSRRWRRRDSQLRCWIFLPTVW